MNDESCEMCDNFEILKTKKRFSATAPRSGVPARRAVIPSGASKRTFTALIGALLPSPETIVNNFIKIKLAICDPKVDKFHENLRI